MNANVIDVLLRQSYLHMLSYALVVAVLFAAVLDAFLIGQLRNALRRENGRLRAGHIQEIPNGADWLGMIHPAAVALGKIQGRTPRVSRSTLQRQVDLAEAALFLPLRARMSLTRDLSTLMGLIATLLALVAAAGDFTRHGKPELLIGSVGTGCVATCVAAIGCAIALWNLSRLTRLRLCTACQCDAALAQIDAEESRGEEIPMRHASQATFRVVNGATNNAHAPL